MLYASIIFLIYKQYPGVKEYLNGFGTLWGQLLSVTTFTLTFFVNQSYALWRKCYELSRRLQGRLHDVGMNLATHAARKVPNAPGETSTYTAASRQILELMSRYIRLFDLLTYASFTRSHRPILTPRGMRRLVERGLMTAQEREVLVDAAIPATQRHSAILMWMIRLFVEGRMSGHILGGDGFEQQTIEKFHVIRAQYGAIGDELQGRMPLAYAHVVQILVDLILWMYPVMAFSIGMSPVVAIAGTGLLTFSYQGLFDLAKQFLDPYDNENYGKGEDPLSVDTLIAETNAGSVRWMYGFEEMPFSQQKLRDGELYEYLLPVRGYTVDELNQMEEEKRLREREMEEQRIKDEQDRIQREADEAKAAAKAAEEKELAQTAEASQMTNVTNSDATFNQTATASQDTVQQAVVEERPVHKITTLPNGTVVSLQDESVTPKQATMKPVAPLPAVPEGVAPYLASLSRESVADSLATNLIPEPQGLGTITPVATDLPQEWLTVEPDDEALNDNKVPLREIIADEELENATEVFAMTLSGDEYQAKLAESQSNTTVELLEAIQIMNTAPVYFVTEKRKERLISSSDDIPLRRISTQSSTPNDAVVQNEKDPSPPLVVEANVAKSGSAATSPIGDTISVDGLDERMIARLVDQVIAELQNKAIKDKSGGTVEKTEGSKKQKSKATDKEQKSKGTDKESSSSSSSVDKMEAPKEVPSRLTLDDYNVQVEKIMEAAKEELLETEAILKARPGADPLGWDYDDKQLAPSTDDSQSVEEAKAKETPPKAEQVVIPVDLDVLEMDKAVNKEERKQVEDLKSSTVETKVENFIGSLAKTDEIESLAASNEEVLPKPVDNDASASGEDPSSHEIQHAQDGEESLVENGDHTNDPVIFDEANAASDVINGEVPKDRDSIEDRTV
jgi:hypothetical protein